MSAVTKSFSLKSATLILFILWLTLYFLGLGQTAITDPNEGYYVEAAREMVESGNWLVPHLNYQTYFSKPILTFWLIAVPYKLFGISEFSARIVFSLLALFLFMAVLSFTYRFRGARSALLAAIICATAPLMMIASRISPIDVELTCFLNVALFAWILDYVFQDRQFWPYFYIFMALAVLVKGPALLVVVLLSIAAFLFVDFLAHKRRVTAEDLKPRFRQIFLGSLIFLLIVLPWYVSIGLATDGLFLKVFFLYENLARFAGYTNLTHTNFYHYVPVLIFGFLPWIVFLPSAIKCLGQNLVNADRHSLGSQSARALSCLCCFAGVLLLVFSCSGTQLDTYILPAIPALSVVIGCYLNDACRQLTAKDNLGFSTFSVISRLVALLGVILLLSLPVLWLLPVTMPIKISILVVEFLLIIGALSQYWFIRKNRPFIALYTFCATTAITCILVFHIVCYLIEIAGQRDLKNLCLFYKKSEDHLLVFHAFKPSILFYTERPVDSFFRTDQLIVQSTQQKSDTGVFEKRKLLVFVSNQYLRLLKDVPQLKLKPLRRLGNWQILLVENAVFHKQPTLETAFKQKEIIKSMFSRENNWGPLTVPYTSGNP